MSLINREMPFFKHYADLSKRPEIKKMMSKKGTIAFGVYLMLLERLIITEGCKEEVDFAVLAWDFGCSEELVRSVLCDFGLFKINVDGDVVTYSSKYLDEQIKK